MDGTGIASRLVRAVRRQSCRLSCRLGRETSLDRPVFVVGCGRSGTTILGNTLSLHPSVAYLNEYRQLWYDAYPETDVWTDLAVDRGGRVDISASVSTPERNKKLIDNFHCEVHAMGRSRLVEKLPINSFRLPFIDAVFDGALYVHLLRNGLEVARSIERMAEEGLWYGHKGRKWELLVDYANRHDRYRELVELCDSARLKGLLEWRMAVDETLTFLATIPEERRLEVRYAELLDSPVETIRRIEQFTGLSRDDTVERFAEANLKRRTSKIEVTSLSETEERIAGDLMRRLGYLRS